MCARLLLRYSLVNTYDGSENENGLVIEVAGITGNASITARCRNPLSLICITIQMPSRMVMMCIHRLRRCGCILCMKRQQGSVVTNHLSMGIGMMAIMWVELEVEGGVLWSWRLLVRPSHRALHQSHHVGSRRWLCRPYRLVPPNPTIEITKQQRQQ